MKRETASYKKLPQIIDFLNDSGKLLGIITSADVVELVDDEMGDDYAKLGGLTSEEDLNEGVFQSVKKRLPWLIALLFLGMLELARQMYDTTNRSRK